MKIRLRKDWTVIAASAFLGLLVGLAFGLQAKAYPSVPSDWRCEYTPSLKPGYKICRPLTQDPIRAEGER